MKVMDKRNLAQIDLNLLYTFHVFVRCGSLRSTAEELSRSEPAVSTRLHQLEADLKIKLFEKVGRRLQLTPAGRVLHEDAKLLAGGLQDFADKAKTLANEPGGRLRLGCLPTIATYMLAGPLARFIIANPQVELIVVHELTTYLVQELREGRIDMLISIGPSPSNLDVVKLTTIQPALTVAACDSLARKKLISPDDIRAERYLGYQRLDDPFFSAVDRFLEKTRLAENISVRVGTIQTLKELIIAGAGVSILPDYTVVDPSLRAVPVVGLRSKLQVWAATRPGARDSPSLQALAEVLEDELG